MTRAGANKAEPVEGSDLKSALLHGTDDGVALEEGKLDVPGVGVVTVRGLTREESHMVAKASDKGTLHAEIQMAVLGLVDPEVTFAEAKLLAKRPAGVLQIITDAIEVLSGLEEGARKEARARFREQRSA